VKAREAEKADSDIKLSVDGMTMIFGGLTALDNVSVKIKKGEILAIIGPNGAGKTVLLNCISGFYRPQKGSIHFNGINISNKPTYQRGRMGLARTFQNIELYSGLTTVENLMAARQSFMKTNFLWNSLYFGPTHKEEILNRRIVEDIIDFLEMEAVRDRIVGVLPYGLRKRVELGRALALEPSILLLDEPMAGMNVEEKEDLSRFIIDVFEGQGKMYPDTPTLRDGVDAIVLIEHDMEVVMSIAHRVIVLDFGHIIAEGTPAEIMSNPAVIKVYLGAEDK